MGVGDGKTREQDEGDERDVGGGEKNEMEKETTEGKSTKTCETN